jgi:hypothetical protein
MMTNAIMYRVAIMAVGTKAAASAEKEEGPLDLSGSSVSKRTAKKVGMRMQVRTDQALVVSSPLVTKTVWKSILIG